MEIHRQQCQQCGSRELRNILVREVGAPMTVYVRCLGCKELVARYRLSEYYHHGKGVDSFLQSLGSGAGESGRDYLGEFSRIQDESMEGYEEVLRRLTEQGKDV